MTITIHAATRDDAADWRRMRDALWPDDDADGHAREIAQYFAGTLRSPLEVLIAADASGRALGFAELSIRNYAEDCETDRIGYLEGWYVEADARRSGVGRSLVQAAEDWALRQGCTEFGSDAVLDNELSAAAHHALGFAETGLIRCFRKSLHGGDLASDTQPASGDPAPAARSVDLTHLIARTLAGHYERVRGKIHGLVQPLSTDQIWQRPYPYGNSIGHLLLHLAGNLSYYIGTQIAGTGYVRDRPLEFADTAHEPKETTIARLDAAVDMVLATLAAQTADDWRAPYHGVGSEDVTDRLGIFVRCAAHADHHAGQMIYLVKALTSA